MIAAPAPTHADLARRVLRAGKDVMVEKPMALTTGDAEELARLAETGDRILMVGHLMDYHPALIALRNMVESGALGTVLRIESRRSNHGVLRSDENAWWSLAPHDISMVLRLMVDWPLAAGATPCMVQAGIADAVGATLHFSGNRVARIDVSWHDISKIRQIKVYGTRRWAMFDDMEPWDRKLIVYDRGFDVTPAGPGERVKIRIRRGSEEAVRLDQTEPLVAEAKHFVACVRTRTRPVSDGRSGSAVIAVLEAGQESLAARREVPVSRPAEGLRIYGCPA